VSCKEITYQNSNQSEKMKKTILKNIPETQAPSKNHPPR
jgi:hypothetical protein